MSRHNNPGYDEMTEWVRNTEIDLGRSQNAYEDCGPMPVQGREHPEANVDGFVPPDEVDWNEVFSDQIAEAPSYEPTEEEKSEVVALIIGDDEDFEGAPQPDNLELPEEPSLDQRFEFRGHVHTWPHLEDVYVAMVMSMEMNHEEPIGEEKIVLETKPLEDGSGRWYVDDVMQGHLFVQHDPDMNHPLSAKARNEEPVIWVYDREKTADFPNEPIGYIHNGSVFRRPKVWQKA